MQIEKMQPSPALPIESQTSGKLHSTTHEQNDSGVKDDPQFPSQQHSYLWFFVFSLNQSCPIFILPAGLTFETPTQNLAT